MARVRRRILPVVGLMYFVAYLDRNNVGFAKLTMSHDIGLSAAGYGFGAGVFFIGYALMEIPSNGGMYRFGARKWIARILISWGIVATSMALVQGEISYSIVRFLLGACEAGLFPAIVFYLTLWFPAAERVTVLGLFILAQPVSSAIGAPISGLVLNITAAGLQGWQWLFIIEGVPAILLGVLTFKLITDRPEKAAWLPVEERTWLMQTLAREVVARAAPGTHRFRDGLKDRRAFVYAFLNFGLVCGIYGFALWLPSVINDLGHFSTLQVGFITFIPYAAAAVFVYYWARHADRTGRRAAHASISMLMAAVGLAAAGLLLSVSAVAALAALTFAAMGVSSATAPLLSMPSAAFVGAAAASSLAAVNAIGNVGGFVSPFIVGILKGATGGDEAGLLFLAGVLVVTAVATFVYGRRRPEGSATHAQESAAGSGRRQRLAGRGRTTRPAPEET